MTDPLLHTWNLNLGYAKRFVADIPDDTMALQPAPGMNHAASVLGHLAYTADMLGSHDRDACSPAHRSPLARLPPALLRRLALPRDHQRPAQVVEGSRCRQGVPIHPQPTKSRALKREAAIKKLRRAEKDRLVAKR